MRILLTVTFLTFASTASAQSDIDYPWSVEFGIGWDNSISGNINSSGIGRINNQAVVILKNSYEDVYGTGLHLRFGGGYLIDEISRFARPSRSSRSTRISRRWVTSARRASTGSTRTTRASDSTWASAATCVRAAIASSGLMRRARLALRSSTNRRRARGAVDQPRRHCHRFLRSHRRVHARRQRRRALAGRRAGRRVRPDRGAVGVGDVGGRRPGGHRPGAINDKSARWTLPFLVGARGRF